MKDIEKEDVVTRLENRITAMEAKLMICGAFLCVAVILYDIFKHVFFFK